MSRKTIFLITIIIIIILVGLLVVSSKDSGGRLINPIQTPIPSVTPVPPQSGEAGPKTFKFDSSTYLKAELEKVNPQVLDSDFNE